MCHSLGLSKFAEIICLCEQKIRIKENQEFNCANPGKSPPICNKDNSDPETMSWYWEQKFNTGPRHSEAGKTKWARVAESSSVWREKSSVSVPGTCWWTSVTMRRDRDTDKWLNFMASTRNVGLLENLNNSTSNMKKYAWHPKLYAVILRFMIWTAMWKNLYIQYCAQKIAFLLQTSNKKIPYMFNWKRQHGSLVFSIKHKWVNIKVLYKILTSTKYKALSLSFRNWIYKASFFSKIFS